MTVGSSNNSISFKSGIGNLTGNVFVGETHNHTIFGGIVFVLVLNYKTFPGEVISFSFTTPPELNLESLEVSFALDYLDECLEIEKSVSSPTFWRKTMYRRRERSLRKIFLIHFLHTILATGDVFLRAVKIQ